MEKPFIHLLSSINGFYFYDVNKNEVVNVDKEVYDFLTKLLNDEEVKPSEEVKGKLDKLKRNNYLSSNTLKEIRHPESDNLEYLLDRHINQLILQVTQKCNLRCSYCAYSKFDNLDQRSHSNKEMSMETAKRAVDFFLQHSSDTEKVVISFYGGEPLLRFYFIKEIVSYAQESFIGKDLRFSLTTNTTLLTEEVMEYSINNNFDIMISLDGPEEIHNLNRKFSNGTGSFAKVLDNLKKLRNRYGDELKKVLRVNTVMDPKNDFDKMNSIFENDILKYLPVNGVIVEDFFSNERTTYSDKFIEKYIYQIFVGILSLIDAVKDLRTYPLITTIINDMYEFGEKMIETTGLPEIGAPSGPCIPGGRRLFVNVYGKFFPCERVSEVSEVMNIGNLDEGINIKKADNLLNVGRLTTMECKKCWALRKCSICAQKLERDGELSEDAKLSMCDEIRTSIEGKLKEYVLLKECRTIYKI
ncbi:Cys-rich peptide radical SAM maturase CcpM [Clostridium felsineum]|uniref:GTP 3',8-cyclase n=1 Tax=Clostridium felsineum TaxID=36839 RepID=A0A1S8MEP9_9CLOT|nr:Cys-rich peptide radical SAM maturase CcpM [Clostridium felsineum]URZ07467.1 GTP 3',8-cyclase [Clostridium felsineum]URZ12498.1 GTP 3',8-cyclase [Clostridium felsineum]